MSRSRTVFTSGLAVALYTAAAYGALLFLGSGPALACVLSALYGLLVAAFAARVAAREEEVAPEPAVEPEPESASEEGVGFERGFALAESREERESREIQNALLPSRTPQIPGYWVDYSYEPCGALGGDLFDFIPMDDGRLIVTLGDVSGKGPAGAIVMAMVQTLMRREAPFAEGPGDLLRRVNDGFAGTLGKGVFVTAQVGVLDPHGHRFTLAGAGHPPMLLLNPMQRRSTRVAARGVALGLVSGTAFTDGLGETTIDIAPGDSLLLYTDGATEHSEHIATDGGENRFLAAAAAAVLPGPIDALKRLTDDLWDGGGRRDDTTLVLLSRLTERMRRVAPPDRSVGTLKI